MSPPRDTIEFLLGQLDSKLDDLKEQNEVLIKKIESHTSRLEKLEHDGIKTKVLGALVACALFSKDHIGPLLALLIH